MSWAGERGGAAARSGVERIGAEGPVPDDESLVLADSFAGRMAAIADPSAAASSGQPQPYGTGLPAAAGDISRIVDLKGLARPEKLHGLATSWPEWEPKLRAVRSPALKNH